MLGFTQNKINKIKIKQSQIKFIVLALLLCVIAAPIIAELYLSNHICRDHLNQIDFGCKACILAKNINEFLRQFGAYIKTLLFAFVSLFLLITALYINSSRNRLRTPVSLKIRINN